MLQLQPGTWLYLLGSDIQPQCRGDVVMSVGSMWLIGVDACTERKGSASASGTDEFHWHKREISVASRAPSLTLGLLDERDSKSLRESLRFGVASAFHGYCHETAE